MGGRLGSVALLLSPALFALDPPLSHTGGELSHKSRLEEWDASVS